MKQFEGKVDQHAILDLEEGYEQGFIVMKNFIHVNPTALDIANQYFYAKEKNYLTKEDDATRMAQVVVDDDRIAARAIDLLKSRRAGRLTFLPLNKIRASGGAAGAAMAVLISVGIIGRMAPYAALRTRASVWM